MPALDETFGFDALAFATLAVAPLAFVARACFVEVDARLGVTFDADVAFDAVALDASFAFGERVPFTD